VALRLGSVASSPPAGLLILLTPLSGDAWTRTLAHGSLLQPTFLARSLLPVELRVVEPVEPSGVVDLSGDGTSR
jgi:hypothetical protein